MPMQAEEYPPHLPPYTVASQDFRATQVPCDSLQVCSLVRCLASSAGAKHHPCCPPLRPLPCPTVPALITPHVATRAPPCPSSPSLSGGGVGVKCAENSHRSTNVIAFLECTPDTAPTTARGLRPPQEQSCGVGLCAGSQPPAHRYGPQQGPPTVRVKTNV